MNQKQVGFWQLVFGIIALIYAFGDIFGAQWNINSTNLLWLYFGLFALITGWYDLRASKKK